MKKIKWGTRHSNQSALLHTILWVLAALVITITIIFISNANSAPSITDLKPGMSAPSFQLDSVRGDSFSSLELNGQTVLVSFINTQADPTSENADPSRSQIVFLKSMQEQYGDKSVKVLIVDASQLLSGELIHPNDLLNFTYDWSLDDRILVLMDDEDSTTARKYGVSQLPATFLIDSNNMIIQRWDGYASASQLSFALQELVGAPVRRDENFPIQPKGSDISTQCDKETPAQAQFAGLGLARTLSDQIWVIDGGQQWGVGGSWPLQWIILDDEGKTKDHDLHLLVVIHNTETGEQRTLVDEVLQLVPADEARGLLTGFVDPKPSVFMLTQAVYLESTGCYQLTATVTLEGEQELLYTGTGFVQAGK